MRRNRRQAAFYERAGHGAKPAAKGPLRRIVRRGCRRQEFTVPSLQCSGGPAWWVTPAVWHAAATIADMLQRFNPLNRDLIVNVNGTLTHRDNAAVSPFDSSVQGGDAVWEGLRLYNGRIFRLREHLARLRSSAKALAFSDIPADDALIEQIRRTLAANHMTDGVHIRLTLSRGIKYTSGMDPRLNTLGPTLIILAEHKPPVYDSSGISLITSSVRRFPPDCLDPKIHHCNLIQSILAKIEANHAGADDALMLDTRGFVAETNATHLFIITNGVAATSHATACPEGITRTVVLGLCRANGIHVEVRDLSLTEVYRADECFCTGTMGELTPVITVDGRSIGGGERGPVTARLCKLFGRLTRSQGERVMAADKPAARRPKAKRAAKQRPS